MKALFLAECGGNAGLGHLRRSLVLARAMAARGIDCHMALSDASLAADVEAAGISAGPWRDDGPADRDFDLVTVDGYGYDAGLPGRWRARARCCLVIDDLAARPVEADIVLNHNLYGANLDYSAYGAALVLGGGDYSLVQQGFFEAATRPREKPARVLVSFGGADDGTLALPVAQALLDQNRQLKIDVVISALQQPVSGLRGLEAGSGGRLRILHGPDMAAAMAGAAMLVGSAGVTILEALAAGLDLAVCASAQNQRLNIEALDRLGFPALEGYDSGLLAECALERLENGASVPRPRIDGEGAARVTVAMLGFSRPARKEAGCGR